MNLSNKDKNEIKFSRYANKNLHRDVCFNNQNNEANQPYNIIQRKKPRLMSLK